MGGVPRPVAEEISGYLDRIGRHFKHPKVTLLVRNPDVDDGDLLMTLDDPALVLAAIRRVTGHGLVTPPDGRSDDPVLQLNLGQLRDEVRYWRAEAAATLEQAMALLVAKAKGQPKYIDTTGAMAVARFYPARAALEAAIAGDYWGRCENCQEFVRPGDLVIRYADVGEVHARCCGIAGDDLRVGFEIPVDPESVQLDEGEEARLSYCMTVYACDDPYPSSRIHEVLSAARTFDRDSCRICGCTDNAACDTPDGPCHWVEPDLCSNPDCLAAAAAAAT